MKTCNTCGIEMTFTNFYSNGYDYKGKKKYKPKCKKCTEAAVKERLYERVAKLYGKLECKICGYDRCFQALEFHHINSSDKEYLISDMKTMSEEKIKKELEKGVYLCANCHRETHYGFHPEYLK